MLDIENTKCQHMLGCNIEYSEITSADVLLFQILCQGGGPPHINFFLSTILQSSDKNSLKYQRIKGKSLSKTSRLLSMLIEKYHSDIDDIDLSNSA